MFAQESCDRILIPLFRTLERRPVLLVTRVHLRSLRKELLGGIQAAFLGCQMQRRRPAVILAIHFGAALEQQFDYRRAASRRRKMERSEAAVVFRIEVLRVRHQILSYESDVSILSVLMNGQVRASRSRKKYASATADRSSEKDDGQPSR